jgi:hypothetical protein
VLGFPKEDHRYGNEHAHALEGALTCVDGVLDEPGVQRVTEVALTGRSLTPRRIPETRSRLAGLQYRNHGVRETRHVARDARAADARGPRSAPVVREGGKNPRVPQGKGEEAAREERAVVSRGSMWAVHLSYTLGNLMTPAARSRCPHQ